jgi:ABC-2 type transport system permease protein
MRATLSLVRREFSAYFLSPIAYVVFAVFLGVTGYRFNETLGQLTERGPEGVAFPFQYMLTDTWFWLVFLFIPSLLTMRLLAEERGSGTLEMLLTAPLRDWQIVLAKFIACFAFYLLLWVPTLLYLPVLAAAGVDLRPAWSSYLGLALAGGMFLALGLFVSSLVRSQMVSALLSLALSLLFVIAGFWRSDVDTGTAWYRAKSFFAVPLHFERNFSRGVVDTRQIVLYLSVTLFCLFLTVRSLESRRWR